MNDEVTIDRRTLLIALTLMVLIVVICGAMGAYVVSDPGLRSMNNLTTAAAQILLFYPDTLNLDDLYASARDGMFSRLDRYSSYITPERIDRREEEFSGAYHGIGVSIVEHDDGLLIMSVREDGPAGDAGLVSGDIILAADSVSLQDLSVSEASSLLRGPEGTAVDVTVRRAAIGDTTDIRLIRRRLPLIHIPYAGFTPDSLLYIRLLDFTAGAADDLEAALDSLLPQSDLRRGLILDLRGNPGGFVHEALDIADLFLEPGAFMAGTRGRSRWNAAAHRASREDVTDGLPMAVLVDRGSASASELVAGALQQAGRAILVGDTTFGKGLVQGYVDFSDGDGMRLTISRYYFEGDIYLNEFDSTLHDTGHGLVPDYYYAFDPDHRFVRQVENSLLLQRFVAENADELVVAWNAGALDTSWAERFVWFARDEGLTYVSRSTEQAEALIDMIEHVEGSGRSRRLARQLLDMSTRDDQRQYERHRHYLRNRLAQIVVEREYGVYAAYRDVILPDRPEIAFVAGVLAPKP